MPDESNGRFLDIPSIDVNCQDNHGSTLLMNALGIFTAKSFEFSRHLILEKSADVAIKNFSGNNVFHNLAMLSHRAQMSIDKFGDYGGYRKQKKLNEALYRQFFELYISNGIDINEKNVAGDTPLSIALRERNFLFLELLTERADLDVDHLVHDKSELHFFWSVAFDRRAPDLLRRIIAKSKDFALLMQLFDLESGFNAFHSLLDYVVTQFYLHLGRLKTDLGRKYQDYLRTFNSKSVNKLQHESVERIEEESDDDSQRGEGLDEEVSPEEEEFRRARGRVARAQKNYRKKALKKHLLALLKAKSEMYQPKFQAKILRQREEALKGRIVELFDIFHAQGYDFAEKVRLYKQVKKDKNLVEQAKRHFGGRVAQPARAKERVAWRNKKYSVNVDAKSSVFHLAMKRANLFVFEYFFEKLGFVRNECNFLGNSLIHNLVKNYNGASPKMDLKVFNEEYDRNRQKEIEREKLKSLKKSKMFENKQQEQRQPNPNPGYVPFGRRTATKKRAKYAVAKKTTFKRARPVFGQKRPISTATTTTTRVDPVVEEQTIRVLRKLLELGEDPDLQNKAGEFPILKVCHNGGSDLLHLMVSNGANLNVLDRKGNTPLLQFAKRRDVHSCEYLLANGADINLTDRKSRNALHWSLNETTPENSNNFDLEEVLIKRGVDVNKQDADGKPPIFYLFTKIKEEFINDKLDPIEIFSYLLAKGKVDLTATDANGNQLIHFCAQRGAYLCMIYLLRAGVDVNVLNHHQNSALNISILNNQNDVAIILLQHNSHVNRSIQIVDYDSLKKHRRLQRELRRKAKERQAASAIDEEKSESEREEAEDELEDEDGLVAHAIQEKFREDDESEDEDDWMDYWSQWGKGRRRKKRPFERAEDESHDEEDEAETNQQNHGFRPYFGHYNSGGAFGMTDWQRRSMRNQLQQTLKAKLQRAKEREQLEELAKNSFIKGKESQFKIALKNSMLSVNFLLVDFAFNIGRALMDTFSLKNWDYSRTLLNKKVQDDQFISKDSKGRTALHYLAYFGNALDSKSLEYFIDRLVDKGVDIRARDCMQRKAVHYAALSGNLAFIHLVKGRDPQLHQKDVLGNSLLSLYLQCHSISKEKLESFVQEYKNDVNVVFKVPHDDFIKEIESFDEFAHTSGDPETHLKKLLKVRPKALPWFDSERKFREGERVPEAKASPFKIYTPLIYLAHEKRNLVLTENLIEMGADLNLKDQNGETILAKAILANDLEMLEVLKKHSNLIDFTTGSVGTYSNRSGQEQTQLLAHGRQPLLLGHVQKLGHAGLLAGPRRPGTAGQQWPDRPVVRSGPGRRLDVIRDSEPCRVGQSSQATARRCQKRLGEPAVDGGQLV